MNYLHFSDVVALVNIIPSKLVKFTSVGFIALLIAGCSGDEEPISEDNAVTPYEEIVEADDAPVQEEVFLHGFRPGKLEVAFEFT